MAKETVIVFDGEDKFIATKNKEYDKVTGFANVVGAGENTPSTAESLFTPPEKMPIPSPSDSAFCEKAEYFIRTNGNNTATPEEVMQVAASFRQNCQRPTPDVEPSLLVINWASLSCDEITAKIKEIEDLLAVSRMPLEERARYEAAVERGKEAKVEKCGITPPALPDLPPPPTPTPTPKPILSGLGIPPKRSGGADGGGQQEKKKSNLWIWLLVAAGAYLLLSGDKKN
jgi:hypothetical protein